MVTELSRRLGSLRSDGDSVLLSQEQGPPLTLPLLGMIREAGVPIVMSPDLHPDAVRLGGTTALMSAAYVGAVDPARDLIERGADLASQDEQGFSPLMYAANAGQERLAQMLIVAGADVNQVDHAGSTPLMFAAQHGHLRIVKKLLAGGANVGARRNDGLTAHELAIRNGHDRVAATLPRPGQNRVTPSALAPTAVRRTWSSA